MSLPRLPEFTYAGAAYNWHGRLVRDRADLPLRWTPLNAAAEAATAGSEQVRVLLDVEDGLSGRLLRPPRVVVFVDLYPTDATIYVQHIADGHGTPAQDPDLDSVWGVSSGVLADYLTAQQEWLRSRGILVLWVRWQLIGQFDGLPWQADLASLVPAEEYRGGEVIYLSVVNLEIRLSPVGGDFDISDGTLAPPGEDFAITPPPGTPGADPKYLHVEDYSDVTFDEVDLASDAATYLEHAERFQRLRWVFNFHATPLTFYPPEGYTPASVTPELTTIPDGVRARMEQFAEDTGAIFAESMTAADIHSQVQAFFEG